jgi:fatty acid desaturase
VSRFRPFFRYNGLDAIPVLCGVGILALILWTFLGFNALSWWVLAPAYIAIAWSYCWNLQCISHNFIHNPYFSWGWLNRAFGVLETLNLGVPHILYHHYHMNHHWGDNDAIGPNGTTKDWSSIYRHGKDGKPENFWKYIFVSYFRVELAPVLQTVGKHGKSHGFQLAIEAVALGAFWIAMLLVNWQYFVGYYLTSYYLGWVLSYAEGYLEHYGCQPGNQYANSVSSYNLLYNVLWFNNGYHQEHHWAPKVHWSQMGQLHEQIKDKLIANGTRTLRGPHLTGFIEDWLIGRNPARQSANVPTEENRSAA